MDACEILDATVANTVGCAIPGAPGRVGSGVRSTHQHQSFNVFLVDFFDGGLFFFLPLSLKGTGTREKETSNSKKSTRHKESK